MVPGDDVEGLLDAIGALVRDHARRKRIGYAAQEHMSRRGFAKAFAQLWEMYTSGQATSFGPLNFAASVAPIVMNEALAS